jgi:hypothetical protein
VVGREETWEVRPNLPTVEECVEEATPFIVVRHGELENDHNVGFDVDGLKNCNGRRGGGGIIADRVGEGDIRVSSESEEPRANRGFSSMVGMAVGKAAAGEEQRRERQCSKHDGEGSIRVS